MQVAIVRNVHEALPEGCHRMLELAHERPSRNGPVWVFPGPFVTCYTRPEERVLFHPERDANPFFHLMESVWMLAGRDDVEWISEYSSGISQFSDNGVLFNGAYGRRWRHWFDIDQLELIVQRLRDNPNCRRQVLGMWDSAVDLSHQHTKDVPCNTHAYVQVGLDDRLDMMVCNRSNDMIWGTYGANAVHFSVLQEYLAACVGREVGHYWQVSMNTHVYERHFGLTRSRAQQAPQPPAQPRSPYRTGCAHKTVVVAGADLDDWHRDLRDFMQDKSEMRTEHFDRLVTVRDSWRAFKDKSDPHRHETAIDILQDLPPRSDWRLACSQWLERRIK